MRRLTRPEFAWPAAVVTLLTAGVAMTFGVLWISRSDGGAQVVERYYRRGVAWDSVAEARTLLSHAGLAIDIEPAPSADSDGMRSVAVSVTDSLGRAVQGLVLRVSASRPSRARPIGSAGAEPAPDGGYRARLPVDSAGLWDFDVTGELRGRPFGIRVRRELLR